MFSKSGLNLSMVGNNIMSKKVVVFDFDQTISQLHVFKCLAGWEARALFPAPYAASEVGQIRRLLDLGEADKSFFPDVLGG